MFQVFGGCYFGEHLELIGVEPAIDGLEMERMQVIGGPVDLNGAVVEEFGVAVPIPGGGAVAISGVEEAVVGEEAIGGGDGLLGWQVEDIGESEGLAVLVEFAAEDAGVKAETLAVGDEAEFGVVLSGDG